MFKFNSGKINAGVLIFTLLLTLSFVFMMQGSACALTSLTGGSLGTVGVPINDDVEITSGTVTATATAAGGSFTINGNLTVKSGATLSCVGYSTGDYGVTITAHNITVENGGTISANGKGFAGGPAGVYYAAANGFGEGHGTGGGSNGASGGGYGAAGGNGYSIPGGLAYPASGGITNPIRLGSGGGGDIGAGGAGGGAIKLVVQNAFSGVLNNSGIISANGNNGVNKGGGGSGGSIWVVCDSLTGNGLFSANGGLGSPVTGVCYSGGGGGGGRISLQPANEATTYDNYIGSITVSPGLGGGGVAGGTINRDAVTNNLSDITIPAGTTITLTCGTHTFKSLILPSTSTIQTGVGTTGSIGFSPGGGAGGGPHGASGAGGTYGGKGGRSYDTSANTTTYGDSDAPLVLGSGGGGGQGSGTVVIGGSGGGIINIVTTGDMQINGIISGDGGNGTGGVDYGGGGGSGGSIWLNCGGNFSGTGSISAKGGNGVPNTAYTSGGGGAGGRIKIDMPATGAYTDTYAGDLIVSGGIGAVGAEPGTIVRDAAPTLGNVEIGTVEIPKTVTWSLGTYNFNNLTVNTGSTLTTGTPVGSSVNYTLTACGLGAGRGGNPGGSGAGHASAGGNGTSAGGAAYDTYVDAGSVFHLTGGNQMLEPTDLGSGGGGSYTGPAARNGNKGGAGGGALKIVLKNGADGVLKNNGIMSVSAGAAGAGNASGGTGGGSGGSLWVDAKSLSGTGAFEANGTAGTGTGTNGGGGSGGRLSFYFVSTLPDFNPSSVTANGAAGGSGGTAGGAGTIYGLLYSSITFPPAPNMSYQKTLQPSGITGVAGNYVGGTLSVTISIKDNSPSSPTYGQYYGGTSFNAGTTESAAWLPVTTGTTSWSYAIADNKFTSGNSYIIHSKATSSNGPIVETPSAGVTFTYDTTPPQATATPITGDATGGTVTTSAGNKIHTFTTTGSFVANASINPAVLVVAGGGGGYEGGGGGGGLIYNPSFNVPVGTYTATVGSGGPVSSNGQDSVFSSLTAIGGGAGAAYNSNGNTGGSGGGGGRYLGIAGAGTLNQGNAGGNGSVGNDTSGGGGGAGAVGIAGTVGACGGGGNGLPNSISGLSVYYSGGGGAGSAFGGVTQGAGGLGGGGAGAGGKATSGTENTGGGGGGSPTSGTSCGGLCGGAGGSGIIIVKYPSIDLGISAAEEQAGFPVVVSLGTSNAVAGDTLTLLLGGSTVLSNYTLTSTDITAGYYIFTIQHGQLGVVEGSKTITSRVTDMAGNQGAASSPLTLTLDLNLPAVPTITSFATDNNINNSEKAAIVVVGTAEANSTVNVSLSDAGSAHTVTKSGTATGGNYSITLDGATLNDGTITVSVTSTDAAGNSSSAVVVPTVTKDIIAPNVPIIGSFAATGDGSIIIGDYLNSTNTGFTVTFTSPATEFLGTAHLYVNNTLFANDIITTVSEGTHLYTLTGNSQSITDLGADGIKALTVKIIDAVGNVSAASSTTLPASIVVNHVAGVVAPVTKTVTYGIVTTSISGASKSWITRNLGATTQATAKDDNTESSAGWYWQFNRKQGYQHNGTTRTPSTAWTAVNQVSEWVTANDPCTIELGTNWRLPTNAEWTAADAAPQSWSTNALTYASVLKLHSPGFLTTGAGALSARGTQGAYWSSTSGGGSSDAYFLAVETSSVYINNWTKAFGNCARCLRDPGIILDKVAPTNQNDVFGASLTKWGGNSVTIVSSGVVSNNIWLAPSGTTLFSAGATMTTAPGTATSILAPVTEGNYNLFVLDAAGNYSSASTAVLTVVNTSPANLAQYQKNGTTSINVGGASSSQYAVFKFDMSSTIASATLVPQIEVKPVGTDFDGQPGSITEGAAVVYSGTGSVTGSVTYLGLAFNATTPQPYHWRARIKNAAGDVSLWTSFGSNAESEADIKGALGVNITTATTWAVSKDVVDIPNLYIAPNITLTLDSINKTGGAGQIVLTTENLWIGTNAKISANATGYAGGLGTWSGTSGLGPPGTNGGGIYNGKGGSGGGHANDGGHSQEINQAPTAGGSAYNTDGNQIIAPTDLGSGGGGGAASAGGKGGGSIKLDVSGILTNQGTISANGVTATAGSGGSGPGGGGSGGSVWIVTSNFINSGLVQATGGGSSGVTNNLHGGGGSGGRISFNVGSWENSGSFSASGGACVGTAPPVMDGVGGDGTINGAVFSNITFPVNSSDYNASNWNTISGTAVDYTGGAISLVQLSIKQLSDNMFYDSSTGSFSSASEVWLNATNTTSWSYTLANTKLLATGSSYLIRSKSTNNVTPTPVVETPGSGITFSYDATAPGIQSVALDPSSGYRKLGETVGITVTASGAEPNSKLLTPSAMIFNGRSIVLSPSSSNAGPFIGTYTVSADDSNNTNPSTNEITLTDSANNVTSPAVVGTSSLTIDTKIPEITLVDLSPNNGYAKIGDTVTITAHVTHEESGLTASAAKLLTALNATFNGKSLAPSSGPTGSNPYTFTYTYNVTENTDNDNPAAEATNIIVQDAAGNQSVAGVSSGNTLKIDAHRPVVTDEKISIAGTHSSSTVYFVGQTVTASWDNRASGDNNSDIASVTCDFSALGGGSSVAMTASNGVYTADYTISSTSISGTTHTISVKATDNAGNITTTADTTLIKVGAGSLTLASPAPGTFKAGTTQTITWTKTGDTASVSLKYSTDGGVTYPNTIASNQSSAGSYSWTVPSYLTSSLRLKVEDELINEVYAASATNSNIIAPTISILTPTATNISLAVGQMYDITWSSDGVINANSITLAYSVDGGSTYTTIASTEANDGTYSWTVPVVPTPGTTNKVKVTGTFTSQNGTEDILNLSANNFTIIPGVISPAEVYPALTSMYGDYDTGLGPRGVAFDSSTNSIWVANYSGNSVSKFNASTGIKIADYATGTNPWGIAFDSSTNSIWVANYGSANVSKFNASTGAKIADYATGVGPRGVVFDSSTNSIWVANYSGNSVSKFNASTGAKIGDYAVGTNPFGIAFDSSTNSIWVANYVSDTVSKLDASTGAKIADYATGPYPSDVAFDSSTNSIWVTSFNGNSVSKFSASTGAKIADYDTGTKPYSVAFDSSTNSVWVANYGSNTVSKLDASTGVKIADYPTGTAPWDVAFDSSTNSVWVANYSSNSVSKIKVSDGSRNGYYATGTSPRSVAFDSFTNSIWVTNYTPNTVSKFNASTGAKISDYATGTGPMFVVFDSSTNSIWVTNYTANTVSKLNASTGAKIADYATGTGPFGVVFDSSTNSIWVTNRGSNTVSKLNASTGAKISDYATGTNPYGVAFDSSTNSIWVTNYDSNTVSKLNASTGAKIADYVTGTGPFGVAFDPSTNSIWVTNYTSNTVSKFNASTGAKIADYATGTGPRGVVFDPSTNSIWVVNYYSNIYRFNAATGLKIADYVAGTATSSVAFDSFTNSIWTQNQASNTIFKIRLAFLAGNVGSVDALFTLNNAIPADGKIIITFPVNFVLSSGGTTAASSATLDGSFSTTISGQVVAIVRSGGTVGAAGSHRITLSNIKSPTVIGATGTYLIESRNAANNTSDISAAITGTTLVAGPTSRITLSAPADITAGSTRAAYAITRYDQYDNLSKLNNETFNLLTTSIGASAKFYDADSEGNEITSVTLDSGASSGSFWYGDTKMGAYTLTATKSDQPLVLITDALNVKHTTPDHLKFASDIVTPDGKQASVPFDLPQIVAVDQYDNTLTSDYSATAYSGSKGITYTLSGLSNAPDYNPPSVLIGKDTFSSDNIESGNVNFVNGVSTSALGAILYRAQDTTIVAADATLPGTNIVSNVVTVNPNTAVKLRFKQQPSASAIVNSAFAQQPVVSILDTYGNQTSNIFSIKIYDSSRSALPFADAPGGVLSSDHTDNTLAAINGESTFSGVKYSASGSIYLYAEALGAGSGIYPAFSSAISLGTAQTTAVEVAATPVVSFNIIPTNDTLAEKFAVLKFKVHDLGGDSTPTLIDQIKIAVGGTGANAATDIAWAGLYVGEVKVADATSIANDYITFGVVSDSNSTAALSSVADNTATEFTVYVYMKPEKLTSLDGQSYTFTTNEGDIGVDTGASSRIAANTSSIATVTGTIKVDVSHLEVVTAAGNSTLMLVAGTPAELLVRATDANKNIDKDYTGNRTMVFSGLNSVGTLPNVSYPMIESTLFDYNITLSFAQGVSVAEGVTLSAFKKESKTVVVQDWTGGSNLHYGQHGLVTTVNAGAASNIAILSGNSQSGRTSWPLAQSFVAIVTDTYGNGASAGTAVNFAISSKPSGATGASLSTTSGVTDSDGQTSTTLTIGNLSGAYQVTATSTNLTGSPLTFNATGLLPSAIQVFSGNNQSNQAATALANPLIIKIVDASGIAIPYETVNFAISSFPTDATGQVLSASSTATDVNGQAQVALTLGTKVGSYKVTVSSGSLTAIELTATATAKAPYKVVLSGPVSVKAGDISTVFAVSIQDEYSNVSNVSSSTVFSLTKNPLRPNGVFYSNSDGSGMITSLTIANGANSGSFYYKDTATGTANLVVTRTSGQSLTVPSSTQAVTIIPADAYRFTVTGATDTIATGESKALIITAYDTQGNVKDDYTGDVNVIFSGASASPAPSAKKATCSNKGNLDDVAFGQSTALAFVNGAATTTAKLYKAEDVSLKVTSGSVTTADTDDLNFTVKHGAVNHLKFTGNLPTPQTVGTEFNFETTLNAVDLYDNICNGANGADAYSSSPTVSWALSGASNGPEGNVTDQFVSPVAFSAGVSTTLLKAKLYRAQDTTITASTAALAGSNIASNVITVNAGAVAKLRFSQQPAVSCITSQLLSTQPKVSVSDQYGNAVSGSSANVTLAASTDNSVFTPVTNGILSASGGLTVSTVNGVAEFTGLTYNYPESIYLRASVSGVDLTSVFSSGITFSTALEGAVSLGAVVPPTSISSLAYTSADKVGVLNFKITDGGTDGFATKVKQVIVKRDTADTTAGWTNFLQGVYLTDGATQVVGRIEDDQIIFGLGESDIYSVTNGTVKNFTVSVFLKNPLPLAADNKVLAFKITPATDIVFGSPSSRLSPSNALTASQSIAVVATNFIISGSATMNAGETQAITLKAIDILGNIDKDYSGEKTVVLSGANVSLKGNQPFETTSNITFGTDTPVSFANGQSSSTVGIKLFKAETAYIKASDVTAGITTSNANALIVTVSGGVANGLSWLTQPVSVAVENAPWKEFAIVVVDAYGNTSSSDVNVTVAPSDGNLSTGAVAIVNTKDTSGIATFYGFAVKDLTDGQKITLSGTASTLTGSTGVSNEVQVFKKYAVTINIKDYTSASNLTECILGATSNGVAVEGFPKTGNSPFTFSIPYGAYTFQVSKEKYVDESTEKTAGVAADFLDGVYDAKIAWTLTATSLVEATSDYKVQTAFVYNESTDKLSIRVWVEKRGKMVVNDDVNKLGIVTVDIYDDATNAWMDSITITPPAASNTTNGVYYKEIPNVVATGDGFDLVSGKTYFARATLNYGGLTGTARSYEGGTTFSVTINENLKAVTSAIQTVTTSIANQTSAIQKTVKEEIEGQITGVVVPKISEVLTATGTEPLATKIADVKTQILSEVKPHVQSGILTRATTIKLGDTVDISYRTTTGLAPLITVYDSKERARISSKTMTEIGVTGVYVYPVKFLSSWGVGEFTVVCTEPTNGTVDALAMTVAQENLGDISGQVSAVLGSTTGLSGLKTVSDTIGTQFADMDKLLAQISKDVAGKLGDAKSAVNDLAGAFKQLEEMSKQIKDIGGTTGINLEKLYAVSKDKKEDITYIKNKSEELKAAMEINQKLMQNVANKPVVQTWFEFK